MEKDEPKQKITELIASYKKLKPKEIRTYTEADTRRTFILPLFKALGWDVSSREDVTEEEAVSRKRVDYAFRLRGIPKFFLEAKSLKAGLENPEYARQAINYAWHKAATWAVLTDFHGLKVYNAEWKESSVPRSLAFELTFDQYLSRFDLLWLLSYPACQQNLLDKWALEEFKKTKKVPVGQQLLSDFVSWRTLLYKYLSKYNRLYTPNLIEEAVQRILDRLIFIRTCEDREIEPPTLRPLIREQQNGAQNNFLRELKLIWRNFDRDYDSRLFLPHLADELDCEPTPFVEIIEGLYASKDGSFEYDLNAIDADVLGGVYEQYLEHLIKRVGRGVEAVSERGKRKTQGIYYTPKFIVRYIVENALAPALEGKSFEEASKINILDPACGSGSFLVESLDYLERYWKKQKWLAESATSSKDFFDFVTRFRFLTENLYGVDLDSQAVEIAQLNLLLKALGQKVRLPNLVNNIREGNSLISGTEEELRSYFGDNWSDKKSFNWEEKFSEVMDKGGFDVVIGNPPYGIVFDESQKRYLNNAYPSFKRNNDMFVAFMERAIRLLKNGGFLSLIVPNTFLIGPYFNNMKKNILQSCNIVKVLNLGAIQVFNQPDVFNAILVLQKENNENTRNRQEVAFIEALNKNIFEPEHLRIQVKNQRELVDLHWKPLDSITAKVMRVTTTLGKMAKVKDVGFNYWTIGRGKTRGDSIGSRILYTGVRQNEQDIPYLKGRDINRYYSNFGSHFLRHNYKQLLDSQCDVFGFGQEFFECEEKIIYRQTADRIVATIDRQKYYIDKTLHIVLLEDAFRRQLSTKYILAILNSKLASYIYQNLTGEKNRLFAQVKTFIMKKIPIYTVDVSNTVEKGMHDSLVALVDKMLELNKKLSPIRDTPCNEREELLKQIEQTDNQIDNLVYDLYGLTEEERKIVQANI